MKLSYENEDMKKALLVRWILAHSQLTGDPSNPILNGGGGVVGGGSSYLRTGDRA